MDYNNIKEEKEYILNETINHLNQRMYFLIVGIENKNIDKFALNEFGMSHKQELEMIEGKRRQIIAEILRRKYKELKEITVEKKKEIQIDGILKREIANYIIKILEPLLTEQELKGVFRQGYRLMR